MAVFVYVTGLDIKIAVTQKVSERRHLLFVKLLEHGKLE